MSSTLYDQVRLRLANSFLQASTCNQEKQIQPTVAPNVAASLHLRWMVAFITATSFSLYSNTPLERTTYTRTDFIDLYPNKQKCQLPHATFSPLTKSADSKVTDHQLPPLETYLPL